MLSTQLIVLYLGNCPLIPNYYLLKTYNFPRLVKVIFLLLVFAIIGNSITYARDQPHERLTDAIVELNPFDSVRIDSLWQVSLKYMKSAEDSFLTDIYFSWSVFFNDQFQFDTAQYFIDLSIATYDIANRNPSALAESYYLLGNILYDQEKVGAAINTYHKALRIFDSLKVYSESAHLLNVIANSYAYINENELAENNYLRAITIQKGFNDSSSVSYMLGNLGSLYTSMKKYDLALDVYEESLEWSHGSVVQKLEAEFGIAIIHHALGAYDKALVGYQLSQSLCNELKDYVQLAYVYQNFADLYLNMGKLDLVEGYLDMASALGVQYSIAGFEFGLDEIRHQYYYQLGDHRLAYDLLKKSRAASDSFYDLDIMKQLQEVEVEYELIRQENELALKDLELTRAAEKLEKWRKQRSILIAVALIFLIVAIMILRSQRLKAKANRLLAIKNIEIQDMNQEIQKMESAKSKWFVNISHELRTPLTLIQGPIKHALSVLPKQDPVIKDLEVADRNVARLQKLINEILDLSNMEAGRIQLNKGEFDLVNTISIVIASFDHLSRELNIDIKFDHASADLLLVFGDQDKIQNVLVNLIASAFDASKKNDFIHVLLESGDELVLTIKDTGRGMSKEVLERIFDQDFQSETLHSGERDGFGVGLVLAREIINLHEANLNVESLEGLGTKYTIRFPKGMVLFSERFEDAAIPVLADYKERKHGEPFVNKILVVDDNLDMRQYITKLLKSDYEVTTACDGMDALEQLKISVPDLIISDVMMPRMDGITFAREVKKSAEWSHIPFVTISAIGEEQEKVSTLRIGIDDYLVKPFNPEELIVRVENLLRNNQERNKPELSDEEEIPVEQKLIKTLEQFVLDDIKNSTINVARLAEIVSMSERQVYRYIRKMTGLSPANFVKEIRLQKAKDLLMKNSYSRASEIAYAVGFQQPGYFSTVFKKRFGRSPMEYMD